MQVMELVEKHVSLRTSICEASCNRRRNAAPQGCVSLLPHNSTEHANLRTCVRMQHARTLMAQTQPRPAAHWHTHAPCQAVAPLLFQSSVEAADVSSQHLRIKCEAGQGCTWHVQQGGKQRVPPSKPHL